MEQRSKEWFRARLGIPTASNFDKIITASGSPSQQAQSYMCRLIGERLLGRSLEEDISGLKWVAHGRAYENEAARQFEIVSGKVVAPVGFVTVHEGRLGCSPDRLIVGENAALEIKCPSPWKHIEYLLFGPGKEYKPQVQGQMLVGGYDIVYFFSYFPGMPSVFIEFRRDDKFIRLLHDALVSFNETMDRRLKDFAKFDPIDCEMVLDVLSKLMPEV